MWTFNVQTFDSGQNVRGQIEIVRAYFKKGRGRGNKIDRGNVCRRNVGKRKIKKKVVEFDEE